MRLMSETCSGFTEGLETFDLAAARNLLDEPAVEHRGTWAGRLSLQRSSAVP